MSSATPPPTDLTARARIRDAAITCFADTGMAGTSIRAIAAAAEVSPALVMHHFGSKDALRTACDHHAAALVRASKEAAIAQGVDVDPVQALRGHDVDVPLLRYLATTLADGSPHVGSLLDELVADAVAYSQRAIDNGLMTPSPDLEARTAVMVLWSFGAMVLHEHVERLLGVDITGHPRDMGRYAVAAAEIIGTGVFVPGIYERIRDTFPTPGAHTEQEAS